MNGELFRQRLRKARQDAGMTQDDLGDYVRCSGSTIGRIESQGRMPSLPKAKRIADALGVSLDWLTGRDEIWGPMEDYIVYGPEGQRLRFVMPKGEEGDKVVRRLREIADDQRTAITGHLRGPAIRHETFTFAMAHINRWEKLVS